jgi:hypothetical protein
MATYEQWNESLLEYVISGVPRGARVYLAIDYDVIEFIASRLGTVPGDFLEVVQLRCIKQKAIDLSRFFSRSKAQEDYEQTPQYFAFLCSMVMAAYRMGDDIDQGIASINYFYHFNSIMGLPTDQGRPHGMAHGGEEELWRDWNNWLRFHGYQPTAFMKADHYFTYARSQALLRQSDKNTLWKFFSNNQNKYSELLDKDDILLKLRSDINYLTKYLKELLEMDGKIGSQRYDALAEAIFENFEAWIASGKQSEPTEALIGISHNILAMGLYRVEDFRSRQSKFYLLPKQPKRYIGDSEISVFYKDKQESLTKDRPGWFEPLPPALAIEEIEDGVILAIDGSQVARQLILPKQDFWILLHDPEYQDSGVYASWEERPELGISFVLLIKKYLEPDLIFLRDEGMLTWSNIPKTMGDWLEYSDIVVISDAWGSVSITSKKLLNQLRPRSSVSISLSGGMRDPLTNAWLVNHGPEIMIFAFDEDLELEIVRTGQEEIFQRFTVNSGNITRPEWDIPGHYQIRVRSGNDIAGERQAAILDWGSISLSKPGNHKPVRIGFASVYGAWIDGE